MKNMFYMLSNEEDYPLLVSRLIQMSANPNKRVGYIGSQKMVNEQGEIIYHSFELDNCVGLLISKEGGLIEMFVRNPKHAQNTGGLLSQLTKIPKDKFIPAD